MKYYLESQEQVLRELQSDRLGLTADEAAKRLAEHGPNRLAEGKSESLLHRFVRQLADPMIIMLMAAALISAATALYAHEPFTDVIIILAVILFNAVLGVVQESKAEKSIQALSDMMGSTAKVLRNGILTLTRSEDLVAGDVIVIEAGDAVPADGRLLEAASLQMEESALTGESTAVNKLIDILTLSESEDVLLGDRRNMIFSGSACVYGRGRAVVTATGMDTEMGRIAAALQQTRDTRTPLQEKLAELGKLLTKLVLGICVAVFAVTLLRQGNFSGTAILKTFMTAIALAVAAIPEGMPAVVTVLLSMGVTRMSRRNAIVRQLPAVETLGCTQIICTDKTGTLTQNRMTVTDTYGPDQALLARAMALCSDAELDGERGVGVGEPTEAALVTYAASLAQRKNELKLAAPRVGEAPFDSMRKLMSTVHRKDGRTIQYTKGAPDVLLELCSAYLTEDGRAEPMTEEKRREILAANKSFADRALRVLAAAYREYDTAPQVYEAAEMEQQLTFIGLTGMIDPCRPEVLEAMRQCREAGIRAVMITGDHKDTAVAIGLELGVIKDAAEAITGAELEKLSDRELAERVERYGVYARVQPEHKVRIVRAWQARGKVVSMTGDGVNDAPALKSADIGVGMGITGTDVSKSVSDIVLADDNFATIVHAVEEGRRIYDNIRKVIQFQMSTNAAEVLTVFICSVLGFNIFSAVQLLWINMITDCAPGLALGTERAEKDVMRRPPRSKDEGFFSGGMTLDIILQGLAITLLVIAAYFLGHFVENGQWTLGASVDGSTMAFLTLSMAETFHSLNMRSRRSSLFTIGHRNRWLGGAVLLSVVTTVLVIYVPALSAAFGFAALSGQEFLIGVGLAVLVIPLVELAKVFRRGAEGKG